MCSPKNLFHQKRKEKKTLFIKTVFLSPKKTFLMKNFFNKKYFFELKKNCEKNTKKSNCDNWKNQIVTKQNKTKK